MNALPIILISMTLAGAGSVETETELLYSEDDLFYMSHIVQAEAGYCSTEMMEGVASVVINRVNDDRFPDTVMGVVTQNGQYSPWASGSFWNEPTEEAIAVSIDILENGSKYPEDVIWQANYPQGSETYKVLSTTYSTMYFCR